MQINNFKLKVLPVSKKMMRFSVQLLNDPEEAKDVVQDIFLKIWQRKDDLDTIGNIDAFLMRMVRNRCLDLIRKRKNIGGKENPENNKPDGVHDFSDEVEMKDTALNIKMLISSLPEQQQTVMYLRDVENHEYEEIAEITGMNINAIRVNLSRARKKVRDELLNTWKNENERSKTVAKEIF